MADETDFSQLRCRYARTDYGAPLLIFEDENGDTSYVLHGEHSDLTRPEPEISHEVAKEIARRWAGGESPPLRSRVDDLERVVKVLADARRGCGQEGHFDCRVISVKVLQGNVMDVSELHAKREAASSQEPQVGGTEE